VTAEKDSQGLCFIGGSFTGILQKQKPKEVIIQIDKNDGIYAIQEQEGLSQEEVLSLASNKKYTFEMGKVVGIKGLIILVNEKDSMWEE
jgi:tRNA-specific 2-thiouridylase